jgi:polysaccharide pyruvyl transferase WcaK-like protein
MGFGKQDKLQTFGFDEGWYIWRYPDVKHAIDRKEIPSARMHYVLHGYKEGRAPVASHPTGRVFAYGSFGSNNVGDEAILEGLKRIYPACIQIYHNKPRSGVGYLPSDILERKVSFRPDDYLIIGGGGLLYDRSTVVLMTRLAKAAQEAGAAVDILRVGCEAAGPDYEKEICELFAYARRITVRSTVSQEIMERISKNRYGVEFDFAFNLSKEVDAIPRIRRSNARFATIGIVTASVARAELDLLADFVFSHIRNGAIAPARFVHIPHSRSYFDVSNNDCITGHQLWSLSRTHNSMDADMLAIRAFDGDPLSVLSYYTQLDGVISARYHGLIFGKLAKVPTLAIGASQIKIRSYIQDHSSDSLFSASTYADLPKAYLPFYDFVHAGLTRRDTDSLPV